jgi:hypothetical protein
MTDKIDKLDAKTLAALQAIDPLIWIHANKLKLGGGPYRVKKHEYQQGLFEESHRKQVCIKGAQMGITEVWVLKTLHGMIHGQYPAGALYLFPTQNDVGDFSKARFDPLIGENPGIGVFVRSTDSQHIKRVGHGFLYLRGARATKAIGGEKKSSTALKSIPVDRIVFDERDEMSDEMVTLAEERVSHSSVQELMYLGTPTIPDFGVDKMFQNSSQNVWQIKCKACGKETCLELEFPNCVQMEPKTERWFRACRKCGREIFPKDGRWEPLYPSKSKDLVGWWISQLNSMYIDPGKILRLFENPPHGDLSEIMNSKLGRAYIAAENRLTPDLVWGCCSEDYMQTKADGPSYMGVDVGKTLHVVIGQRTTRKLMKITKVARVGAFSDLHDLARRFNVKCMVIDYKPEIRKVRELQNTERFPVYACDYVERKTGQAAWDENDMFVKVNRTEICDATHEAVINPGRLALPKRNTEMKEYVKEMCNMAKTLIEDPITGGKEYRYRKLGADHYRHATNYAYLASERVGVQSDHEMVKKYFGRRRRSAGKTGWMSA